METKPPREIFFKKRVLGEDESQESKQQWDFLGDEAKFSAAWKMVKTAHLIKGGTLDELRFQRSIANIFRK